MRIRGERVKYLIGAVVGCLLFFVGSIIYYPAIYLATHIKFDISMMELFQEIGKYSFSGGISMLQYISYIPFLIFAIYLFHKEIAEDFKQFIKNIKMNLLLIIGGIVAIYFVSFIVTIVYTALGDTGTSENEEIINTILLSNGAIPMIISVVFLAPFAEEMLFRKILIGTCEKSFKFPAWAAILISSFIFSFIHVSDLASLKYIFQYLPLAVIICLVYHFSKNNIFTSISLHLINNTISVIMLYLSNYVQSISQ